MSNIVNPFLPGHKSVNGDKELRGTKRKAKGDPYNLDDDGSTPKLTPSTQRALSRISSEAPSPSINGRPSSASKATTKRRNRSSGIRKSDVAEESRVDANANLARAKEPQAARLQPQPESEYTQSSLAPVANMGIPEPAKQINAVASTQNPAINVTAEPKPVGKQAAKDSTKNNTKGKAKATKVDKEEEEPNEVDDGEIKEVKALLKHRFAPDDSDRVQLLVHWVGEKEEDATWEMEDNIQDGAAETLYAYWKARGNRVNALFHQPKNPLPEVYHVYNILDHVRKPRTGAGFEFEVQWVGHPATRGETTMEPESKLRKTAPEKLAEYWDVKGGRDKFLSKRGRNKKPRNQ